MKREEIHQLYRKIATKATIVHLDRMKKFIADKFFNEFGKAPLASLKYFIDVGRFPDQEEVNLLDKQNLEFISAKYRRQDIKEKHAKNCMNQDILNDNTEEISLPPFS